MDIAGCLRGRGKGERRRRPRSYQEPPSVRRCIACARYDCVHQVCRVRRREVDFFEALSPSALSVSARCSRYRERPATAAS